MEKRALITGITGQDGSYLAELLLEKGYKVAGIAPSSSSHVNIEHILGEITLLEGDSADPVFIDAALEMHVPDEIYNLASVSTVMDPWANPEETVRSTGLSPLHYLEKIRTSLSKARFFQASSAEMFGVADESPQNEDTRLQPRNPYGAGKSLAHLAIGTYRSQQGMYAVSGILFNHESPRRKEHFITRKITQTLARIAGGSTDVLSCGNLDSQRDWGYAKEYVEGMWLSLQQDSATDYVFATGQTHTVRELIEIAAQALKMPITWEGQGIEEKGHNPDGKIIVKVDPAFFRPAEPVQLVGDASKAERELGWKARTSFKELIKVMAESDFHSLSSL